MAVSGNVTTARGETLNMDELKNKANLPLAKSKQKNSTIKPKVKPKKALNVRGYVPAQGEHVMAPMSKEVEQRIEFIESSEGGKTIAHDTIPPIAAHSKTGTAETLADVTAVKVTATPDAIKRKNAELAQEEISEESNEALEDILNDLESHEESEVKTKETTKRIRKKTTE